MVTDPYVTLGVSKNASPEEIKKAYRKKAKQYHPDLHPNDPTASEKMNEINEAYDMLCNPEKYAAGNRRQSSYQQARQQYQNASGSGSYQNQTGQYQTGGYRGYQGEGGWNSDFGFGFEEIFRQFAGYGSTQTNTRPQYEAADSQPIRMTIDAINNRRFADAKQMLTQIPSIGRNGRWYYLYAMACKGNGENDRAIDFMQRAVQLEPNNRMYHQLLNQYRSAGQTYTYGSYGQEQRQSGGLHTFSFGKIIIGFFLLQFLLRILFGLLGGGMGGGGFFIF